MNSLLSHKWILKRCKQQIVHNLFLYISNAKKERKMKKNEKATKRRERIVERSER